MLPRGLHAWNQKLLFPIGFGQMIERDPNLIVEAGWLWLLFLLLLGPFTIPIVGTMEERRAKGDTATAMIALISIRIKQAHVGVSAGFGLMVHIEK
jgi:hypothetical protein